MAQVAALGDLDQAAASPLFDPREQTVIRYALASTRDVSIRDALHDILAEHLTPTELVELAAVVAGYNMVARFLLALQVPPEP